MLTSYLTRTKQLLQYPVQAVGNIYSDADLTSWINQARGQLAGETECCRYLGTLTTSLNVRNYNFSAISLGVNTGLAGVINVRQMMLAVASGYQWLRPRPWSWYWLFKYSNPVPQPGVPTVFSQFSQGGSGQGSITGIGSGSITSGSFYLDPPPDLTYQLLIDCSCYPNALVADTDVEAIPYLFTDAIAYFAGYLALMSAQANARLDQAQRLFDLYKMFVDRANKASAPDVNRFLYERQQSPTMINKLGVQKSAEGG